MALQELADSIKQAEPAAERDHVAVVYDGDCPFCKRYVAMLRLREVAGSVDLIDARSDHELAVWARRRFDLDDGMAVRIHGVWRTGGDAVNALALLTGPSTALNKLHFYVFRNKRLSAVLYPVLRGGRNLALRLLGRRKISETFPEG